MDEPAQLTPLDPNYIKVMRIVGASFGAVLLAGAAAIEFVRLLPPGAAIVPVALLLGWLLGWLPPRRYKRWGYHAADDRLRIEHGYLFYSDTVVPFGRIQHIDVDQGPIERRYDLATLAVHTAGTHGDTISLPGLKHADALALRERIREHIRQAQR